MNARANEGRGHLYELAVTQRASRVLLAEDDEYMRRLLASSLRRDGFEVIEARNGSELLEWIGSLLLRPGDGRPVDLVISDVRMPVATGLDVLAGLRRADWSTPVILITAFGDSATHAEARMLGAAAVFDKPFDVDDLRTAALHFVGHGGGEPPTWREWTDLGGESGS